MFGWMNKRIDERIGNAIASARTMFVGWADTFRTRREMGPDELVRQYVSTLYTAATINASSVASSTIRAYVMTDQRRDRRTRFATRPLSSEQHRWLKSSLGRKLAPLSLGRVHELEEHPALTLLEEVNEHIDGYSLLELTSLFGDMVGRCYWLIVPGALGQPAAIWLAPPQFVTPHVSADGVLDHYEYRAGNKSLKLSPDDVIAFRYPSLRDPYFGGHSPATAMATEHGLVRGDSDLQTSFLNNRARPELIMSPKDMNGSMDTTEVERLTTRIRRAFSRGGAGGVLGLPVPMDIKELTLVSREMEGLARRKVNREEIFNALGVPLALTSTQTNLANLQAALVQHGRLAIVPRLTRICQVLNQRYMRMFDPSGRIFLWYDNPIPEDDQRRALVHQTYLQSNVLLLNEVREEIGKEPVPWGDKPWINQALTQPSSTPELNERQPRPEPSEFMLRSGGGRPKAAPSGKDIDALRVYEILADHVCERLSRKVAIAELVKAGASLAAAYDWTEPPQIESPALCREKDADWTHPQWHQGVKTAKGGHHRNLPNGRAIMRAFRQVVREQRASLLRGLKRHVGRKDEADELRGLGTIDLSEWDEELRRRVTPAIQLDYERGLQEARARLGLSDDEAFRVTNPKVRRAIERAAMNLSASANRTTAELLNAQIEQLRERLAEGILGDSNTPRELTRIVQEVFGHAEKYRAEAIALTESSRAVHHAQRIADTESGVVSGWLWLLSEDACELCQAILARYPEGITLDQSFGEAASYEAGPDTVNPAYGDIPAPPAHVRCRCTMVAKINLDALKERNES